MNGKTGRGDVKVRGNIEAKGEGAGKRRNDRGEVGKWGSAKMQGR
jgi:hypothetical protein